MTTPICLTSYLAFKTAPRAGEDFLALRLQNQGCTVEGCEPAPISYAAVQNIWLLRKCLPHQSLSHENLVLRALGFLLESLNFTVAVTVAGDLGVWRRLRWLVQRQWQDSGKPFNTMAKSSAFGSQMIWIQVQLLCLAVGGP